MATVLEPSIAREPAPESSDRGFGFVFAAVFAIYGGWPLIHGVSPRWWAVAVAALFLAIALIHPQLLHPLNRVWLALGRLLHKIVSPIVMGAVYFLAVTPTGWFMRATGKDVLALKRRPDLTSYWVKRDGAAPETQSMKNQF